MLNFSKTASLPTFSNRFNAFLTAFLISYGLSGPGLIPSKIPNIGIRNAPDPDVVGFAIGVIIAFILAMIATLIGANLIGPVATAVGGALNNKNLTGAANSLTAQVTLIFVTVVIVGVVTFLALFGGLATRAQKEA